MLSAIEEMLNIKALFVATTDFELVLFPKDNLLRKGERNRKATVQNITSEF